MQLSPSDANRLDNIVDFDGRLEKEFTFQDFGLTLGVDCFNLFNEAFILQRVARARGSFYSARGVGFINETLSPRIFRFGAGSGQRRARARGAAARVGEARAP